MVKRDQKVNKKIQAKSLIGFRLDDFDIKAQKIKAISTKILHIQGVLYRNANNFNSISMFYIL